MSTRQATDTLLESNPFLFNKETRRLFLESFRETADHHYSANPYFRAFWSHANLSPSDIKTEADLERVPGMLVNLFKEWDLCSVDRGDIVLKLTSSGTGGQKSQMLLNQGSLDRVKKLAYRIHKELGITSSELYNYICFTYDPRVAKDLGTAFTDELLTSFTGVSSAYYAFQWSDAKNEFILNEEALIEKLKAFEKQKRPLRILGFPAFLYKIIREHNLRFNFGRDSWVQTGGGWKGLAAEEIPKAEFRGFVSEHLGIPEQNVRDLFGMVEHGIPYVDCAKGRLHVPNYARVFIRNPATMGVLPDGETGLIQFVCTYNDSYPAMSILATDWGRVSECDCGIAGKTLEIRGRAGVNKHKGCAIHALEALK